ncbi:hypothetical protein [Marinirhabdus gelatinilytica]|uniref:Uncharacterized protein n=1 Tax=Marinirhabdus gelatinilytica TaxID=1703343 RepID=A0A370Q655_9FLAO|nr:hypothetical protein [Marinirhabdus gelatinilytica]RDK83837.1 hypothetical protein C8D94_10650 [Marinirhabdus gelatinilytica]
MKRYLLLTLFLLSTFCQNVLAQKCKPSLSKVDEMTNEKVEGWGGKIGGQTSLGNKIGHDTMLYLNDRDKGDTLINATVYINYIVLAKNAAILDKTHQAGERILLKTENSLIQFTTDNVIKNEKSTFGSYYQIFELNGKITIEEAKILSENFLEMYRIEKEEGGSIVQDKPNKRAKRKMKEQFECFLNTLK